MRGYCSWVSVCTDMQGRLDIELCEDAEGSRIASARRPHVRQGRVFRKGSDEALLVSDLRALLPEGDSAVWIREGLSRLDLGEAEKLYGECGGVPYDPRGMLGILLYAYMEGEPGSRTIAKRCLKDVGYMHVGYGQKPDDRTIRRRFAPPRSTTKPPGCGASLAPWRHCSNGNAPARGV